ncbi:MAG: hypothetical protein QOH93_809, partial [Chloroflexia bacterium]|nr:hypothetical protein [Chloroflexia bacterium]
MLSSGVTAGLILFFRTVAYYSGRGTFFFALIPVFSMSLNLTVRFIGMLLFAAAGLVLGLNLSSVMPPEAPGSFNAVVLYLPLLGALLGFVATPFLTVYPLRALRHRLRTASGGDLASAAFGLFVGLLLGALLGWPLSTLPVPVGQIAPTVGALVFAGLGLYMAVLHRHDLAESVRSLRAGSPGRGATQPRISFTDTSTLSGKLASESLNESDRIQLDKYLLVDTSAIIDGRIADISKTGFIDGTLLVPRFVLNELQHIADSADPLRRARGRRGLDMLNRLQKEAVVPIQVSEVDAEDVPDVDSKLVKIARVYHCPVITNDFNLNRVAEIQ